MAPNAPLSGLFLPASVAAIRRATSPNEALSYYKAWIQLRRPRERPFDPHAAVFALKACSFESVLIPHLHAYVVKSNLFSHVHVSTTLLYAYSSSLTQARLLFDEMPHRNVVTSNAMLTCLSRHGDLPAARLLFNSMHERDVASWSAMIGAYMDRGCRDHGLALFREMVLGGQTAPDELLLVTVLSGCASTGSFALLGKSIHAHLKRHGLTVNVQLGTALIDMYMKCGCLMSAFSVFERIPERNVMHWTAMICGLAWHGHGPDALAFFVKMRREGVRPNGITFTGVLSACCHTGLVEEGEGYFRSMVEEFGIKPGIHHYGCMVELFAKVGRLEDAYGVIKSMKIEPNIIVWTSLLSACQKYGNFEIAERVIDKVLEMADPNVDGGIYTLISNLYVMGRRWNDAERVRGLMDNNNVKKNRGSSFVLGKKTQKSPLACLNVDYLDLGEAMG